MHKIKLVAVPFIILLWVITRYLLICSELRGLEDALKRAGLHRAVQEPGLQQEFLSATASLICRRAF